MPMLPSKVYVYQVSLYLSAYIPLAVPHGNPTNNYLQNIHWPCIYTIQLYNGQQMEPL